jgi:hypothetical protein
VFSPDEIIMHQMVVARSPLAALLSAIGRLTSPFHDVPPGQESINPRIDGEPILVGEVNGLSYLCEDHGTVFALCWGLLTTVSRELDLLVIGSCFDPMEEQCELLVASNGDVVRAFWSNPMRTTQIYELGKPLPCEAKSPLSAYGGVGLRTALRTFGFSLMDYDQFDADRMVTWRGDSLALLEADEMGKPVRDHVRAFANPAYRPPEPKVTVRWL